MTDLVTALGNAVMQQTAITVGKVKWYIFWGSVGAPEIIAVLLTILTIIYWRKANKADKNLPFKMMKILWVTVLVGAFWGILFQWGMQETVAYITGVAPSYKAVILAGTSTGLVAMGTFELMKWWCLRKKWMGAYEFLAVKHRSAEGDVGDSPNGDITRGMDNQESETD